MVFYKEFKQFIAKGNAIELAIGVIVGAAFGKIVSSLVNDILMPPLGLLLGGVSFSDLRIVLKSAGVDSAGKPFQAVSLNYGAFVQTLFDFAIIAFCLFTVVKAVNVLREMTKKDDAAADAEQTAEVKLLTEIRDSLKK